MALNSWLVCVCANFDLIENIIMKMVLCIANSSVVNGVCGCARIIACRLRLYVLYIAEVQGPP